MVTPYERTHFVDRNPARAHVPCGSCKLCCYLMVPLAEEEFANYDWAWVIIDGKPITRSLRRNPDGSCVYLGPNGCTIHDRVPHVCRRFDCREVFAKSDRAKRRQMIKSGQFPKAIFVKGREMLEWSREHQAGGTATTELVGQHIDPYGASVS